MLRKILILTFGFLAGILCTTSFTYAAPTAQNFTNIQPFTTDTYNNGTASLEWLNTYTKNLFSVSGTTTNLALLGVLSCNTNAALTTNSSGSIICGAISTGSTFGTTSLSALYPVIYNNITAQFSLAFGTTTSNTFLTQQTFNNTFTSNSSSTNSTTTNMSLLGVPSCNTNSALVTDSQGNITCGLINGGAGSTFGTTSISALYPILYNNATAQFSLAFGTTTVNNFSTQQTFNGGIITNNSTTTNATTSVFSVTNNAIINNLTTTGTTTFNNGFISLGSSTINGDLIITGNSTTTNATTTSLFVSNLATINNLLVNGGATTSSLFVTSSTTIGGAFNAGNTTIGGTFNVSNLSTFNGGFISNSSSTIKGDLIITGNSTTTNATTTSFFATNARFTNGSTTNFTVSSLGGNPGGCVIVNAAGTLSTQACATGSLTSYDAFTHPASGQSATTSILITTGGLIVNAASSTIQGNLLISNNLGIGTTSPVSQVSIATGTLLVSEYVISPTSTTQTVNWNNSTQQLYRMGSANTTFTFTGYSVGQTLRLVVCNPPTVTAGTITWPLTVRWAEALIPSNTTQSNRCDLYSFIDTQGTSTTAKADTIFGAITTGF